MQGCNPNRLPTKSHLHTKGIEGKRIHVPHVNMIVRHFMTSRTPIQSPNVPSNIQNKVFAAARSKERHLENVHINHK